MGSKKDTFNFLDLDEESRIDFVNNALMDMLQIQDPAGNHSNVLEVLSPNARKPVDVLKEIQTRHDKLEAKFIKEKAALKAKYLKLYEPLYSKRYAIVNGIAETEGGKTAAPTNQSEQDGNEKGIPDFWLNAMKNNETVVEEISVRDEGALKFLKDIKWSKIDNPEGFKLEFYFDTNPYFKNSILTKIYHVSSDHLPSLKQVFGTEIDWYLNNCLTQKVVKNKPRKGFKDAKPVTTTEKCGSFFDFFSPPRIPEKGEDIDDETAAKLKIVLDRDYDVGATIRDDLIPHAVSWFTGEAAEDDYSEYYEVDYEDADKDEEEEHDEDEEARLRKKKSGMVATGDGQPGERA